MPIQKNQRYTLTITAIGEKGSGIAYLDGIPIYIPNTLLGETIEILLVKVNSNHAFGKCLKIIHPSPDRITAPCLVAQHCGGCQLQHQKYDGQLKFKTQWITQVLSPFQCRISPIIANTALHYRNKAQFAIGKQNDITAIGLYATNSHRIINTPECAIQEADINRVLQITRRFIDDTQQSIYNETDHTGLLRHLVIRKGTRTKELMACLVINGTQIPNYEKWTFALKTLPDMKSVLMNINTKKTDAILSPNTITLWGKDHIYEAIGNLRYKVSLQSFMQLNSEQCEKLYNWIKSKIEESNSQIVWDLFCGIGSITCYVANIVQQITGIEENDSAVKDAQFNAQLNHCLNATFIRADLENHLDKLPTNTPDCVIIDPPRKGCTPELLSELIRRSPQTILYISCNPKSLAADLKTLTQNKRYRVTEIQPFDMFPQTTHIEIACRLEKV